MELQAKNKGKKILSFVDWNLKPFATTDEFQSFAR